MKMNEFVQNHRSQLQQLNIPSPLYASLASQLQQTFVPPKSNDDNDNDTLVDLDQLVQAGYQNMLLVDAETTTDYGCTLVIPHVCSWDILAEPRRGFWNALESLPTSVLVEVQKGLQTYWSSDDGGGEETSQEKSSSNGCYENNHQYTGDAETSRDFRYKLINQICDNRTWSRVILYRHQDGVRAALPAPPYLPQLEVVIESDHTEPDLVGPFPFTYHMSIIQDIQIDCSLAYLSPDVTIDSGNDNKKRLPTIDLVPAYSVPNSLTRAVRYAALLGDQAPLWCQTMVKEKYAEFVKNMHLVRQQATDLNNETTINIHDPIDGNNDRVWKIYTDSDDPMELAHPEAGLTSPNFTLVNSMKDADMIFSYRSLFAPGELRKFVEQHSNILINQFPFEGALVQKDHLARETLQQHGLPRPKWALESYDLDIQLMEFVASSLLARERGEESLWIIKPARGTQSQGHVITSSTAHVLKLVDSGGGSRVAQRYIKNPICYDGRKVDCRCVVMMTSASPPGRPTLFMHNRVYFRIARKEHSIQEPFDLLDHERVLTAMHLLDDKKGNECDSVLPVDYKTISKLESDYKDIGFDWKKSILPQIHEMVRELFNGMTVAYPAMAESMQSRGLYGIDVMFEIERESVVTKLTEVTFCPANNAVCLAYERDEQLYRNYNNDIFRCLLFEQVGSSVTRIQ